MSLSRDECDWEWEYEYSAHETESLYFTLDLTTHVPDALTDQPHLVSGQTSKNLSAPRVDPQSRVSSDEDSSDDDDGDDDDDDEERRGKLPALQILDLHTSNPLIKFEQSVYSAYWTTDLGTQFHIAQTGHNSHPLRKGTILDVLGISRARLLGKPVQLIDRNAPSHPIPSHSKPTPSSNPVVEQEDDDDDQDSSMVLTTGPLKIPRSILKTDKSKSQASFLERLSEIKHRKGERDQVPILAVKHYTKPDNHDEIKRRAEDDDRNSALVHIDGRKRRRRRPMGVRPRKNMGGAGRPSRGDIEGSLGWSSSGGGIIPEHGQDDDGDGEAVLGVGMFEPGGTGEMRGDVVGYLEDPFQMHAAASSSAAAGDLDVNMEGGEGERQSAVMSGPSSFSSPAAAYQHTDARFMKSNQHGYLAFQSRKEYLDSVRGEGTPRGPKQPGRPPWIGGGGVGQTEQGQGREQDQEHGQEREREQDQEQGRELGQKQADGGADNTTGGSGQQ
ncbi:uncharacterized protein RCC_00593 [Ramularia collo-cygni]|uniref:Transcription factor TFIIIC triple barrel domain-containing protein n=1 Tax=Ramularia collo-cygni TaxID=112498 RepID=A0A2D3UM11_9PEZI|nr:uncharacterized protein RCC_00593 [Ramularia collo-cygni]CZT14621.1 uncharacterized protein RCC_00593 [Ramularia collo-cygni]